MVTWQQLIRPQDSIAPQRFFAERATFAPQGGNRASRNDAWWMAKFAHLAYAEDATIDACLAAIGMQRRAVAMPPGHDTLGTQFFIAGGAGAGSGDGPGGTVLAFRGTEPTELVDPTVDAIAKRHRPDPAAQDRWVHTGFHLAHAAVAKLIEPALRGCAQPLWIAGHSLGGALAAIAAAQHPDARVYTFGQPHIGSGAYVAPMDRPGFVRVEHRCDIVPRVVGLLRSYRKAGRRRYLAEGAAVRHEEDLLDGPTGGPAELLVDFLTLAALVPRLMLRELLRDPRAFAERLARQPKRLLKLARDVAALRDRGVPDGEELSDWGNALLGLAREARGIDAARFAHRALEIVSAGRGLPGTDGEVLSPALADHAIERYVAKVAASDPAAW